jgi:hypothetical protein
MSLTLYDKQQKYTVHNVDMQGECLADIKARYCYWPKNHYHVTSKNPIKITRGIKADGTVNEIGANGVKNKHFGYHRYYMTRLAFDNFCKTNEVTVLTFLD